MTKKLCVAVLKNGRHFGSLALPYLSLCVLKLQFRIAFGFDKWVQCYCCCCRDIVCFKLFVAFLYGLKEINLIKHTLDMFDQKQIMENRDRN